MPSRKEPFVTGNIYHIFNKTIDRKRVFQQDTYARAFYDRLIYYRSTQAIISFSNLPRLKSKDLQYLKIKIDSKEHFQVEVFNYCLMPNHYHLLVKQLRDDGVKNFMSKTTNSFTRYLNVREKRQGQIFLKDFKAQRIISDEQLMHISRYIDLNYYSSGLVSNLEDLTRLTWLGFPAYLGIKKDSLVNANPILGMFKDKQEYKEFVFTRAEYQKELAYIKQFEKA